ncbi:MAG TPA: hypothetical protein VN653_01750 [Anaerolineales bacterium]|nr:hypothetical protein [Anaerolineales bacterium]
MKKIFIVLLAVVLAACSAPAAPTEAPTAAPVEPSPTPVVVVQTVVVEATLAPTEVPPPTAIPPTAVPPTVAPVVVTVVVQPTQPPAAVVADTPAAGGPIPVDNALGRGAFTNMTMSSNAFTLRCAPRDITFNVTAQNNDIRDVVFYYRVVDLKRLYPSEWKAFGKMVANGSGTFNLTFTGENIHPDIRIDGSWLDFQFVGLNKTGDVVDRSEKIEQLVKFTFDCP